MVEMNLAENKDETEDVKLVDVGRFLKWSEGINNEL